MMKLTALTLFLLTHNLLVNSDRSVDVTDVFDSVLNKAEQYLRDMDLSVLPIPDVDLTFNNVKIGFQTVNGYVKAKEGTLKKTTSLHRVGPVYATIDAQNVLHLAVDVAFDELFVHYEVFDFSVWIGSSKGGLDVKIDNNKFHIKTALQHEGGNCKITVEEAEAVELSGFDLHLLPSGITNYFKDKALDIFLNKDNSLAVYAVDKVLKEKLQESIEKLKICEYLKKNIHL